MKTISAKTIFITVLMAVMATLCKAQDVTLVHPAHSVNAHVSTGGAKSDSSKHIVVPADQVRQATMQKKLAAKAILAAQKAKDSTAVSKGDALLPKANSITAKTAANTAPRKSGPRYPVGAKSGPVTKPLTTE